MFALGGIVYLENNDNVGDGVNEESVHSNNTQTNNKPVHTNGEVSAVTGGNCASYEEARDRLQEILRKLQEPSQSLEASLKLWEEGRLLVGYCEEVLQDAMKRLNYGDTTNPEDASLKESEA
ncbi:exodeoxyribonuclease VII small subunit [Tropheryma whipplei]|uniref:Exodeoxyribonuclease 7 small subunit n=1 Tax=Tropheryma whipplei (strain Twist) TaxID=203267 RepID=Q83FR6_TROWT|nr:exodeoxyribonuclease VII small subunit [Tropheryma whipplei]AAO44741.1 exodeoxyribonuclease VII small subunit [Tropheryma whipplei str. Twist]